MNAATYIDTALRNVLPDGVPPSYRAINTARYIGSGRTRKAVGDLTMFDGRAGSVEVWEAAPCTAHHFTSLPGGDVSFESGAWHRVGILYFPYPSR